MEELFLGYFKDTLVIKKMTKILSDIIKIIDSISFSQEKRNLLVKKLYMFIENKNNMASVLEFSDSPKSGGSCGCKKGGSCCKNGG